jgi:hypothetical protein
MIACRLRTLACAAVLLALTACTTVTLAPAGPYAVGGQSVTLGRSWSDISIIMPGRPKTVRLLSIDGPLLNRLYIADGLTSGQFLVKPLRKERPTPTWKSGMSPNEQVEFVADSVSALDFQRVETSALRPARVGGVDGLRFDIAGKTAEGLDISGLAQIAESGGRLYVILYLAPSEHYFAAQRSEVEGIMTSARLAP